MKDANIGLVTGRPTITEDNRLIEKWGAIAFFDEELRRQLDTFYVLGVAMARASADLLAIQNVRAHSDITATARSSPLAISLCI
jgi:hypothetical protein